MNMTCKTLKYIAEPTQYLNVRMGIKQEKPTCMEYNIIKLGGENVTTLIGVYIAEYKSVMFTVVNNIKSTPIFHNSIIF